MKYTLLALALIAAIPGCSCLRKKDKAPKDKKMTEQKDVKKSTDATMKKATPGKEHMDTKRY